nr:immunoglobulin light chain junction region [Macaca mulatta]
DYYCLICHNNAWLF